ncbi:MAG: serine/threonine protein kinase, partial [Polyangiaceae bacterium]|nr:serine/threonine protein kinase [Polyangiaceae bacterium]
MSVPSSTGTHEVYSSEREVLGKYRLLAKLGEGGMANVHLAVAMGPSGFHKLLVVKQVRMVLVDEPDVLEMFFDEARLAARLNHPNVVQTHEVNATPEGWPFIAMEYLDGQPFHRVLGRLGVGPTRYGNLPLYVRAIADALEGLHYAHELSDYNGAPLNIVHRDVSPHNIFVTYEGQVKLVDFGVAKAVTSAALTRTGALKGKVPYMSPEQATGGVCDRRADVFAMGVVLWNVLSDQRLWQGMPELTVLQNLVGGRIPSPEEGLSAAPAELRAIVARAIAFEPADRYQTAAEMRRDLERYLHSTGASLTPREVGDYVATYFAEERSAMRALIDARLRSAASAPTGEMAAMPMSRPGIVVDASAGIGNSGLTPVSGPAITPSGWQQTGARPLASHSYVTHAGSLAPSMPYPTQVPYPSTLPGAVNPAYPPPPAPASRAMIPVALLLGACVVSGTLWFALRARPQPPLEPTS